MILKSPERPHRAAAPPQLRYVSERWCSECQASQAVATVWEPDTNCEIVVPTECPHCGKDWSNE